MHDSFWTHAADLPVLARLLREAFAQLHSQPLLQNLKEELTEAMRESQQGRTVGPSVKIKDKLPDPPKLGQLDLNKVLEADYFFN